MVGVFFKVQISASADVLDEAVMLSQLGICDQTTGVREVSRELKHRLSSFLTRFTNTRSTVESALQCYRGLDQVEFSLAVCIFLAFVNDLGEVSIG